MENWYKIKKNYQKNANYKGELCQTYTSILAVIKIVLESRMVQNWEFGCIIYSQ